MTDKARPAVVQKVNKPDGTHDYVDKKAEEFGTYNSAADYGVTGVLSPLQYATGTAYGSTGKRVNGSRGKRYDEQEMQRDVAKGSGGGRRRRGADEVNDVEKEQKSAGKRKASDGAADVEEAPTAAEAGDVARPATIIPVYDDGSKRDSPRKKHEHRDQNKDKDSGGKRRKGSSGTKHRKKSGEDSGGKRRKGSAATDDSSGEHEHRNRERKGSGHQHDGGNDSDTEHKHGRRKGSGSGGKRHKTSDATAEENRKRKGSRHDVDDTGRSKHKDKSKHRDKSKHKGTHREQRVPYSGPDGPKPAGYEPLPSSPRVDAGKPTLPGSGPAAPRNGPTPPPVEYLIGSGYWADMGLTAAKLSEQRRPPPPGWQPLPQQGRPVTGVATALDQESSKYVWIVLWLMGQALAFRGNYLKWKARVLLYDLLGEGLSLARAPAATFYINCSLVLLLLSRNTITWLRGTFVNSLIPFDKNITWHKKAGWAIALGSAMHGTAHYFNFHVISQIGSDGQPPDPNLPAPLQFEPGQAPDIYTLAFMTVPGLTGHIILACMALMYTSAWKKNKRQQDGHFEIFWLIHQLWVVFFMCLLVHGTSELLGAPAMAWRYIGGPLALYTLERVLRITRAYDGTRIVKVIAHPADVVELQMAKPNFTHRAGHYLFLCCPPVSRLQWHPFTISSAPEDKYLGVHIRQAGDFTKRLAATLVPSLRPSNAKAGAFDVDLTARNIVQVDGPFGDASEEWADHEISLLVGAGVGVTPFASILKSILHRTKNIDRKTLKEAAVMMRKVYFFWICKDFGTLLWFRDLLDRLEQENIDRVLEIHVHLTAKLSSDQVQQITDAAKAHALRATVTPASDPVTGLRSATAYGRPDWPTIFYDLYRKHTGTDIGVFVCGPSALSKSLREMCARYSDAYHRFVFNKENF